jgi:hypothetical protein
VGHAIEVYSQEKCTMRLSNIIGAAVLTAFFTSAVRPVEAAPTDPIVVNTVDLVKGTVSGTIAGAPFTTPITGFSLLPGTGKTCAILDLELGPIHVALLGLHVDTSQICLTITAFEGKGLLGDLLCGLAGGTLTLQSVIGQLEDLLVTALNDALSEHVHVGADGAGSTVCTGACEILDLVIGPVKLDLLGLRVVLDNCANGPVEVCISATASEGLLGDLLCALDDTTLLKNLTLQDLITLIETLLP